MVPIAKRSHCRGCPRAVPETTVCPVARNIYVASPHDQRSRRAATNSFIFLFTAGPSFWDLLVHGAKDRNFCRHRGCRRARREPPVCPFAQNMHVSRPHGQCSRRRYIQAFLRKAENPMLCVSHCPQSTYEHTYTRRARKRDALYDRVRAADRARTLQIEPERM